MGRGRAEVRAVVGARVLKPGRLGLESQLLVAFDDQLSTVSGEAGPLPRQDPWPSVSSTVKWG